jgi:hypothetical protein
MNIRNARNKTACTMIVTGASYKVKMWVVKEFIPELHTATVIKHSKTAESNTAYRRIAEKTQHKIKLRTGTKQNPKL